MNNSKKEGFIKAKEFIDALQSDGALTDHSTKKRILEFLYPQVIIHDTLVDKMSFWKEKKNFLEDWIIFLNWVADNGEAGHGSLRFNIKAAFIWGKDSNFLFAYEMEYDESRGAGLYVKTINSQIVGNPQKILLPPGADIFMKLISGLSVGALLRCPNCEKVFLNVSKRKMIYCSGNCRAYASIKRTKQKGISNVNIS